MSTFWRPVCFQLLLCLLVVLGSILISAAAAAAAETTQSSLWLQARRHVMMIGTNTALKGRKGKWGLPAGSTSHVSFMNPNHLHLSSVIQTTRGGGGWGDDGGSWGDDGKSKGSDNIDDFYRRFDFDEDDFMDDIADFFDDDDDDDDDDDKNRPYIMSHEIRFPTEGEFFSYGEVNSDEIEVIQYLRDKCIEWIGKYQIGHDLLRNVTSTKKMLKRHNYSSSALSCFQQARDVFLNDTIIQQLLAEEESEDIDEDTVERRCQSFIKECYLTTRFYEAVCYYFLDREETCLEIIDNDILPNIEKLIIANSSTSNTTDLIITRNRTKELRNDAIIWNLVHNQGYAKAASYYLNKKYKECMRKCSKILNTIIPSVRSQLMALEGEVVDLDGDGDGTSLPADEEELVKLQHQIMYLKCCSEVNYMADYFNEHVVKNFNMKQNERCMKACKKILSMKLSTTTTHNPSSTKLDYDEIKRIRWYFDNMQSRAEKIYDYLQTRMEMKHEELGFQEKMVFVILPIALLVLVILKMIVRTALGRGRGGSV